MTRALSEAGVRRETLAYLRLILTIAAHDRGWSVPRLAAASGVSPSTIYRLRRLSRTRSPRIWSRYETLLRLGRAVGLHLEWRRGGPRLRLVG